MSEIVTAQWLMEQEFAPPTARDLLDSGECTPACLLARNETRLCACRCNEYYHGALLDRVVDRSPRPQWWMSVGCPSEFLASLPVVNDDHGNRLYEAREPVVFVRKQGKAWQMVHDAVRPAQGLSTRADVWIPFAGALLKSRRATQAWASMDLIGWTAFDGIGDIAEAKTCAWITLECFYGRPEPAVTAFELLSGVEIAA